MVYIYELSPEICIIPMRILFDISILLKLFPWSEDVYTSFSSFWLLPESSISSRKHKLKFGSKKHYTAIAILLYTLLNPKTSTIL